jgi:plasmid stabilization system protein ParE
MHHARVRREAEVDVDEQAEFYDGEEPGLGLRFIQAVFSHIDVVAMHPKKHRQEIDDVRIALIPKFPFGIFFIIEGDQVIVLAVLDLRRSPRRRLDTLKRRMAGEPRK